VMHDISSSKARASVFFLPSISDLALWPIECNSVKCYATDLNYMRVKKKTRFQVAVA
jgi:hypothetical protein